MHANAAGRQETTLINAPGPQAPVTHEVRHAGKWLHQRYLDLAAEPREVQRQLRGLTAAWPSSAGDAWAFAVGAGPGNVPIRSQVGAALLRELRERGRLRRLPRSAHPGSEHLCQLYTYVRSQESEVADGFRSEGVLLYPSTKQVPELDVMTEMQGHRLRALTIDLAASPGEIHGGLLFVVRSTAM